MKAKQTRLTTDTNDMLEDLVAVRNAKTPHKVTKQSLVAELIEKAHKRECK